MFGYEIVDVALEDVERMVDDAVMRSGVVCWDIIKVLLWDD